MTDGITGELTLQLYTRTRVIQVADYFRVLLGVRMLGYWAVATTERLDESTAASRLKKRRIVNH